MTQTLIQLLVAMNFLLPVSLIAAGLFAVLCFNNASHYTRTQRCNCNTEVYSSNDVVSQQMEIMNSVLMYVNRHTITESAMCCRHRKRKKLRCLSSERVHKHSEYASVWG